ncbi:uncharacterized protein DEA37_0014238 [Paragonimus westermani]|uniref:Uncharacterized protein n=1 Tax=Paragonimus westermani TaxID=34504 RepID=A0A5J4NBZ4_9TREM|nr:uncharacterized protein DEA37_0014238 [Paragonimus westermani]
MSTPSRSVRPSSGVHAPFKSPLRTTGNDAQLREVLSDVCRSPNTPNASSETDTSTGPSCADVRLIGCRCRISETRIKDDSQRIQLITRYWLYTSDDSAVAATGQTGKWTNRGSTLVHSEDCAGPCTVAETGIDKEIARLTAKYMQNRTETLDIEKELAVWRNRMHVYNEVKDACLEIFGRLAHAKGCLIRDLYDQFHLEPDD